MSKQKSKRGWVKRVKKRKSGIITRRRAGKSHLLTGKSKSRKRRLRQSVTLSKSDTRRVRGRV